MATRCSFENSNEVGVFAALTNAYCLTGMLLMNFAGQKLMAVEDGFDRGMYRTVPGVLTLIHCPDPLLGNRYWWIGELLFNLRGRAFGAHPCHPRHNRRQ